MPISLHALMTRSAISPRFAINTLRNINPDAFHQVFVVLSRESLIAPRWQTAAAHTPPAGRSQQSASRLRRRHRTSISFISFIASTMQSTWPTSTWSPTFTNGGRARRRRLVERPHDRRLHLMQRLLRRSAEQQHSPLAGRAAATGAAGADAINLLNCAISNPPAGAARGLTRKLDPNLQIVLLHVELGNLVRLQKFDQLAKLIQLISVHHVSSRASFGTCFVYTLCLLQLDPGLHTRRQNLSASRRHQNHILDPHSKLTRHIDSRLDRDHHSLL